MEKGKLEKYEDLKWINMLLEARTKYTLTDEEEATIIRYYLHQTNRVYETFVRQLYEIVVLEFENYTLNEEKVGTLYPNKLRSITITNEGDYIIYINGQYRIVIIEENNRVILQDIISRKTIASIQDVYTIWNTAITEVVARLKKQKMLSIKRSK